MTRLWASLLTVIIYILSQFLPLLIVKKLPFVQYSGIELTKAVILHTTCSIFNRRHDDYFN